MLNHEDVFERAWAEPGNTRFTLPSLDVNRVLAERYRLDEPLVFTRTMLWDNEVRKARRPDLFIPFVVEAGSAAAWGGDDVFVRRSRQRRWLNPDSYGLVLERTALDHVRQAVTFIGTAECDDEHGRQLHADADQPIFHVEHAVSGEEDRPVNLWRIVHLTSAPDERLTEVFGRIAESPWLPEFVEIYIRDVLGRNLDRKLNTADTR
ncbi:hypothetical protein NLX83_37585 [Allokutzneria sp. A3M-2-11 16]|uniref:hypothetical protein n=1 Tax=Allokutzneria sp. A3M-2-11 16 TaxID=2962043 RepID=UPI0020B63C53|nr:hypothetical protein [Allokutzneria sp. A3M-2-11 16]MCP3804995.1 hypothetical protein [Allokutzneria sp. A3M-2-11 16]